MEWRSAQHADYPSKRIHFTASRKLCSFQPQRGQSRLFHQNPQAKPLKKFSEYFVSIFSIIPAAPFRTGTMAWGGLHAAAQICRSQATASQVAGSHARSALRESRQRLKGCRSFPRSATGGRHRSKAWPSRLRPAQRVDRTAEVRLRSAPAFASLTWPIISLAPVRMPSC